MDNLLLKQQIDTEITNKTTVSSISPTNVGNNIKAVVDYVDQEIGGVSGIPGPVGPQGPAGAQGPVGPAGLTWQGTWDANVMYAENDAVGYAGASWFCTSAVATLGNPSPSVDTTHWALLASVGATGPQGPQGPQGPPGSGGGVVNTYEDVFSFTNSAPFPTSSKTILRFNSAGFSYALPLNVDLGAVIYIYSNVNCTLYNSPNPGNQGGILRTIFNSAGNGDAFKNLQSGIVYRCTYLGNFGSSYGYWNIEIINNL